MIKCSACWTAGWADFIPDRRGFPVCCTAMPYIPWHERKVRKWLARRYPRRS